MPRNQESRLESIQRGQAARIAHTELAEIVFNKESQILSKLISYYRANKLTNEMMLSGIAVISELRSLLGGLEGEIKQGIEAADIEQAQAVEPYS